MPLLEEIVGDIEQCSVISKMDLCKGFHQVSVRLDDQPKTAFREMAHQEGAFWPEKCAQRLC